MNSLHALQILNDLALVLVGESQPDALTAGFMQRLLYHTGFAAGLLLESPPPPATHPYVLVQALGNRDLARRAGSHGSWLDTLGSGDSAVLERLEFSANDFLGAERYRHGLRLRASPNLVLVLLGGSAPPQAEHLPALFDSLMPRFARAYGILRERAEHSRHLTAEIERRRKIEQSQRESEEQARALLELSPQAMLVVDIGTRRTLVVNAQARCLLGLVINELPDTHIIFQRSFPDRAYRQEVRDALRQRSLQALRSNGRLEPLTIRATDSNGVERHVELHAHIIAGRALVSAVDLTERMRNEEALRVAKDVAERVSRAKSQFLSNMSHELRTPLNAILGFAQFLEGDESLSEAHHEHAREILESGHHLLALVDDVLDLTRIESGRVSVSLGAVDLEQVLRETMTLVEAQAHARDIVIEPIGEWPMVLADPTRLRQVLINLLSNAVKYNAEGGRVEVSCEARPGPEPRLRVRVRDTGPGIPDGRMSELFQPFSRLGAEGLGVDGTGIGLVVAKQLIELMGGVIGAESKPGDGSVFWFELKRASEAAPSARPPAVRVTRRERVVPDPAGGQGAHRPRLLVVEDQPMNQRLLGLQLGRIGSFEVLLAQNGAEALDRLHGTDVDLVLTDCNMPYIDGYRLAAAVREREQLVGGHVPIIAVTASAMKEDIERCLAAGMDACLPKPLSVASLGEALDRWLPPEARRVAAHGPIDPRKGYRASLVMMLGPQPDAQAEELLQDFAASASQMMTEAKGLIDAGRARDLGALMHKLKPSAKLVGATVLSTLAELIEEAGKHDDLQAQRELWPFVESVWQRVSADLEPQMVPRTEPPPPVALPVSGSSARPRARLRGLRALVIDDDPFTTRYVSDVLATLGVARVTIAEDGHSGLERVHESGAEIDLVLCDLAMPGMDGVELLRHLADREFAGSFVFMSGADERVLDSVDGLARQHGFNVLGVLRKPFTPDALAALLQQHRPAMARRSRETRLLHVSPEEFEEALRVQGITIHLQPKVLADTLVPVGVEALARWFRGDGGLVPPVTFVRVAEQNGLSDLLFESVLRQSLATVKRLERAGFNLKVSVNVSASSLARVDVVEKILGYALEAEVDPKRLVLEVTETGLVRDLRIALDVLTRLRLHGIELSIDDFGTGYSSIDLLRRVPFTELKVDRSFVMNGVRDASARHIIASSIGLARGLGMRVVAEGVETEAELKLVRDLGCNEIQGYLTGRPMAEAALVAWLRDRPILTYPGAVGASEVRPP